MYYCLNSLRGEIKGDSRSLGYCSNVFQAAGFRKGRLGMLLSLPLYTAGVGVSLYATVSSLGFRV